MTCKKLVYCFATIVAALSFLPDAAAQYNSFQKTVFTGVATAGPIHQSQIIHYHQIQFQVTAGTISSCAVQVDGSNDGTTWNSGSIIATQDCSSGGQSTIVSAAANFVRVNMTALAGTGTPTITVAYLGWINNPAGGGGAGSVTSVGNIPGLALANNGTTNVTWSLVSAPSNSVWGRCVGSLGAPGYCTITPAMLPDLSATYAVKNVTSPTDGCATWIGGKIDSIGTPCGAGAGSGGTVTSVTTPTTGLSPLFTLSINTNTTTPALNFALSNAAANTVWGRCSTSVGSPSYCSITSAMLPDLSSIYQPLLGFTPVNSSVVGAVNGIAQLNNAGIVPNTQLGTNAATAVDTDCLRRSGVYSSCAGSGGAPGGSLGQIPMLNGAGGFQVVTGFGWDPNTLTFNVPGTINILGSAYFLSDVAGSAMPAAGGAQSAFGVDTDGKWKVSENGGIVTELAKVNSNITGSAASVAGSATGNQYYGTDVAGAKGYYNFPVGGGDISSAPAGAQAIAQPGTTSFSVNRFGTIRYCDQFASLQACHDDLAGSSGMLVIPRGTTNSCGTTISTNNVTIVGQGPQVSFLQCTTAGTPVLELTAANGHATVRNMTVQHATNQPTCVGGTGTDTCGEGIQHRTGDNPTIDNVEFKNNYNGFYTSGVTRGIMMNVYANRNVNHGFVFHITTNTMQWNLNTVHSLQNGGDGFHVDNAVNTNQATCGSWQNVTAFANNGYGFFFQTTGTSSGIGDCQFDNAISSTNNNDGFFLDFGPGGGARSQQFQDVFSEQNGTSAINGVAIGTTISPITGAASNVGYGINLVSCDPTPPPQFTGAVLWNNAYSGMYVGCARANVTSVLAHGNGRAASANDYQRAGITIRASGVKIIGGEFDGDTACSAATCQKWGIEVSNSADTPGIVNPSCHSTLTGCVQTTTSPANAYDQRMGPGHDYWDAGAPTITGAVGDIYHRTDGTACSLFAWENGAWVCLTSGGASINAATQYSAPYYSASGSATTLSGVPAPTAPSGVTQYWTSTNVAGAPAAPVWAPVGVVPRASTCTSNIDTILVTDRGGYVSWSDASPCAVGLAQAGSTGFANNFAFTGCNIGVGTVTITPTTSTISYTDGASYTSGAASMTLTTGQCAGIRSTATNYLADKRGYAPAITAKEYTLVNIACTLTSLGAAFTECPNQLSRNFVDLTQMISVQLVINLSATAVTGDLRIDCSNDNTFASPTTLTTFDNPGVNTILLGTVDTIPAGCKTAGGVYLRAGMLNGNTTESPSYRYIRIHVQ